MIPKGHYIMNGITDKAGYTKKIYITNGKSFDYNELSLLKSHIRQQTKIINPR